MPGEHSERGHSTRIDDDRLDAPFTTQEVSNNLVRQDEIFMLPKS